MGQRCRLTWLQSSPGSVLWNTKRQNNWNFIQRGTTAWSRACFTIYSAGNAPQCPKTPVKNLKNRILHCQILSSLSHPYAFAKNIFLDPETIPFIPLLSCRIWQTLRKDIFFVWLLFHSQMFCDIWKCVLRRTLFLLFFS